MSYELTNAAWAVPGLTPTERLVLLRIAYRADTSSRAWPSIKLLVTETGMHQATVYRALLGLEKRSLIVVEGRWSARVYTLNLISQSAKTAGSYSQDAKTISQDAKKSSQDAKDFSQDAKTTRTGQGIGQEQVKVLRARAKPKSVEHVTSQLLPAAPNGAQGGELAKGEQLDTLIAAVRAQRTPTLTRRQATDARRLARDALEAGWDPRLVVAGLVTTSAFSDRAFTFAVDQLRRQVIGDRKSRLTKFEQSEQ